MLFPLSILCLTVLLFIFLLKRLKQPYLIAYMLAGVILGPHVTGAFTDTIIIDAFGEAGIILLMFFLGLEIKIPDNSSLLFQPLLAQGIKTLASILVALTTGWWLNWAAANIFLLAVIFMFNSTAVVSDYLQKNGELQTRPGTTILNMLLLQDIMLAPVLTVFQFLQHKSPDLTKLILAVCSSMLIILLLRATRNKNIFRLPFSVDITNDHDLQVFAAFFVSIGLRIDVSFITGHWLFVTLITCAVLLINSLFSTLVFRLLKYPLRTSIYSGALLSQTGEFSLLACATAYQLHIIDAEFYKLSVTAACLSLLFSTAWITFLRKCIFNNTKGMLTNTMSEHGVYNGAGIDGSKLKETYFENKLLPQRRFLP